MPRDHGVRANTDCVQPGCESGRMHRMRSQHPQTEGKRVWSKREIFQQPGYSTVTLLARLRGLSTSQPRATAMW